MAVDDVDGTTASGLFDLLWGTLADVLGTAATAILLRRAAKRATSRAPELDGLLIQRDTLGYTYTVPGGWQEPGTGPPEAALCELVGELRLLLVELTGTVVVQRLERVPALRTLGLTVQEEEQP
jgi:ADP-ribose pyrophosphatase YjhB (NUDIX family)